MMAALKASLNESAPPATPAAVVPSFRGKCGRLAGSLFVSTGASRRLPAEEALKASGRRPASAKADAHQPAAGSMTGKLTRNGPARGPRRAPLIIVGIGGTAVQVLGKLVDLLHDRIGDESQWPPIQIVLLDSDARALTARSDSEGPYLQLVPIRLRSAESFGSRTAEVLQWLNRRWFYGIPRDLTTASYRPLGRLALITHAARVREVDRSRRVDAPAAASRRPPRPTGHCRRPARDRLGFDLRRHGWRSDPRRGLCRSRRIEAPRALRRRRARRPLACDASRECRARQVDSPTLMPS